MEKISRDNCRRLFNLMVISNQEDIVQSKMNSNTLQGFLVGVQAAMGDLEVKDEVYDFMYDICESRDVYYMPMRTAKFGNALVSSVRKKFRSLSDFETYLKRVEYDEYILFLKNVLYQNEYELFDQKIEGFYLADFALLNKNYVNNK